LPPDLATTTSAGSRNSSGGRGSWISWPRIVNTPTFDTVLENHINTIEAIELREQVGAKRVILTYINHENKPHDELEAFVRQFEGVTVAYDGMAVEV